MLQGKMQEALDWAYDKAIANDNAHDLAKEYRNKTSTTEGAVNHLIKVQAQKAAASGFVTGLGGLATMPITLPANITNVLYVQLKMIAAIAVLGGHDPRSDEVRTRAYLCLIGQSGIEIAKKAGIEIGKKVSHKILEKIPGKVLSEINKKVGFRLVTKFGTKGSVNLVKAIPLVGGVIGGTVDNVSTKTVGRVSKEMFVQS